MGTDTAGITGGARGMGFEAAKILGRDHAVVLADLNDAPMSPTRGRLLG